MKTGMALIAVVTLAVGGAAQGPALRAGRYEKTSETAVPGRAPRVQKENVCFDGPDVADPARAVSSAAERNCKTSDYTVAGATTRFTKSCTIPNGSTVVFDMTMTVTSPESYRGVATIKNGAGGGPYALAAGTTMTTTARRIGDCTK